MKLVPIKMSVVGRVEVFLQGHNTRRESTGVQDSDAFALEVILEVVFWLKVSFPELRGESFWERS